VGGVSRSLVLLLLFGAAVAMPAEAASPPEPEITAAWVSGVTATSAVLQAEVNPEGSSTRYHFEYLTLAAYEANLGAGREPFLGAASVPTANNGLGAGTTPVPVSFSLVAPSNPLVPATSYRYRAVAVNNAGTAATAAHTLRTTAPGPPPGLADGRAWEMVSPIDKGGGAVAGPGALFGGGDIQAAGQGGALTYGSATAFGEAPGAPPASQYISTRTASGWVTQNVSQPLVAGGYGDEPDGVPFRIFSEDLARALLLDPRHCELAEACPRSYSLRDSATGALTPLPAQASGMRVLSASSDLGRVIFESEGDAYEWSGGGLVPISLLPPGAGAGAVFQVATASGAFVFYTEADHDTEADHLYRYDAASEAATDLTPSGEVVGVVGASTSGDTVYYQDGTGLRRWHAGTTTTVALGAGATVPSDYPPATATARVSADGRVLAFLSAAPLTYNNTDAETGLPDTELYIYDADTGALTCASCNPTGERPQGASTIPGALVNGTTTAYRPRALSADGRRLFFDSGDRLSGADTNSSADVYEWEALGEGSCAEAPSCVRLISGGRAEGGTFLDASASGDDAFFLTGDSLVASDPGSIDAYDARVGGGLPEPEPPIPCKGDACQALPSPPEDPTAGTTVEGSPNPPPHYAKERPRHRHRHHKHHRKHRHSHRGHQRRGPR